MAKFVFWACCSMLLYVYVLYPLSARMRAGNVVAPRALRFASPVLWLGALLANVGLVPAPEALGLTGVHIPFDPLYLLLLIMQLGLLTAGVCGYILNRYQRQLGVFRKPYRLLETNLASLIATLRYVHEHINGSFAKPWWIIATVVAYVVLHQLVSTSHMAPSHHHHTSVPRSAIPSHRLDRVPRDSNGAPSYE